MKKRVCQIPFSYVVGLMCLSLTTSINAQEDFQTSTGNVLRLSVSPEVGTVDNFLYGQQTKQDTRYLSLNSSAYVQTQVERNLFTLDATVSHHRFDQFSQDNHSNFVFQPEYRYKMADNKTFHLSGFFQNYYERRGTGLSLGQAETLKVGDTKDFQQLNGAYLFGREDSVAKLKLAVGAQKNQYKTRRDITRVLDNESTSALAAFDYLLSGRTYIASELSYEGTSFRYNPVQDKTKTVALLGMKWQTTLATRLSLLLGYQNIHFDESTFKDDDAFKWRFDVFWHPVDTVNVNLRSERDFDEANRVENSYRIVDSHFVEVKHRITDFINWSAQIGVRNEDIVYQSYRENERYVFGEATLNYKRNDWLSFYLQYHFQDLAADVELLEYQGRGISLGFNVNI